MTPLQGKPRDPRVNAEELHVAAFYGESGHLAVEISMKSRRQPKAAQGAPKGPQAAKKGPQRTAKGAQRQGPGQIKMIPLQTIY